MKHIRFSSIAVVFIAVLSLQSCTLLRFAYSPTIQNVPGFKEKNESRVNAAISSPASGTETNFALQGAYAFANHFAVLASYNGTIKGRDELSYTSNNTTTVDVVEYNRNSLEFGGGVFLPVSPDEKVVIEAYGGYGFGKNNITDGSTGSTAKGFYNSKTNRYFIQPVFSFHPSNYFTLSIPFRYTNIGYNNISTNYTAEDLNNYQLAELGKRRVSFLEPALVLSGASSSMPWLRIQCQMNFSFYLGGPTINYRSNYFSLGFQFDPIQAAKSGKH